MCQKEVAKVCKEWFVVMGETWCSNTVWEYDEN